MLLHFCAELFAHLSCLFFILLLQKKSEHPLRSEGTRKIFTSLEKKEQTISKL